MTYLVVMMQSNLHDIYIKKRAIVLPQHCSQIFFCPNVLDEKMLFVINYNPRGKHVVHILDENDNNCD